MKKLIIAILIGLVVGIIANGITYFDCRDCPEDILMSDAKQTAKEIKDLKGIELYLFGHIFRPITWK